MLLKRKKWIKFILYCNNSNIISEILFIIWIYSIKLLFQQFCVDINIKYITSIFIIIFFAIRFTITFNP